MMVVYEHAMMPWHVFFRAYFYFDKVRTFGDVPWYDKQVSSDDEAQLKKPRDSREYIMQRMIEDIDMPLPTFRKTAHLYRITKWTAFGTQVTVSVSSKVRSASTTMSPIRNIRGSITWSSPQQLL